MATARGADHPSLGTLLRELAGGSTRLLRGELRLARLELEAAAKRTGRGTAAVATGGVLLLLGVMALVTGIILLVGDEWLRGRIWLAAVIITAILGIVAVWMVMLGMSRLSRARVGPDATVATLKEDQEWLRRQLTSGATSS